MLSDERAEAILVLVGGMAVPLATDTEELGPQYLQEKILEVNRHMTNANLYYREVMQSRMSLERGMADAQAIYDILYDETLVSESMLLYSSQKDRDSKTKTILKSHILEIQRFKRDVTGVKHIETIVKLKLNELKSVSQDIQRLRSLMRDSIDTASYRGSEHTHEKGTIHRDPSELLAGVSKVSPKAYDLPSDVFAMPPKVELSPLFEGDDEMSGTGFDILLGDLT